MFSVLALASAADIAKNATGVSYDHIQNTTGVGVVQLRRQTNLVKPCEETYGPYGESDSKSFGEC